MNEKNNFDDVNLVGNELERIKRNQINNNKAFRKSFLAFVVTLFLCNMINEYILIKTPFLLEKKAGGDLGDKRWIIAVSFILLILFSFPLIVFCRIIKKFDIERRLLLVIYILVLLILIGALVFNLISPENQKPLIIIIFITYLLNNCLEGITQLLIEKIIPSFVKFCGINMKYLFAYSIHIGKALGGILFFLFYFFKYKPNEEKSIDKFESIFFIGVTFCFFVISFICYQSLRVRAFTKLRYYED
jgi:MFS family permease